MANKTVQTLILVGAGFIALMFVKLMYDMSRNMAKMTDYVGTLATEVSSMRDSMEVMSGDMSKMRASMESMDANIQGMGNAVRQGGKVFEQWDPTRIMRQ